MHVSLQLLSLFMVSSNFWITPCKYKALLHKEGIIYYYYLFYDPLQENLNVIVVRFLSSRV